MSFKLWHSVSICFEKEKKKEKKEKPFSSSTQWLTLLSLSFFISFFDDRTRNYYRSIIFINSDSYWWKNIFTYTVRLDNENKKHKENDTHALHAIIQLVTEWQTTRYRYTWIHISSSKHVTQIKQIILNILNTNQFNTLSYILSFSFYYFSFILLSLIPNRICSRDRKSLSYQYLRKDRSTFVFMDILFAVYENQRILTDLLLRTQRKPILRVMIHSANLFAVSHES